MSAYNLTHLKELESEVDKESELLSMEIDNITNEGDVINNENVDVAARFITENQNFFGDEITETIEPNIDLVDALAQLDVCVVSCCLCLD